jgi:hypothetical protein
MNFKELENKLIEIAKKHDLLLYSYDINGDFNNTYLTIDFNTKNGDEIRLVINRILTYENTFDRIDKMLPLKENSNVEN